MTPLPPEVLDELRKEYLENFDELLPIVKNNLKQSQWDQVEGHFHRFAGSGSTYGLPDVTKIGRGIESYLQKHPQPSSSLMNEAMACFEKIIEGYKTNNPFKKEAIDLLLQKLA